MARFVCQADQVTSLSPVGASRSGPPGPRRVRQHPRTALGGLAALVAVAAAALLVLGAVPPSGPAQTGVPIGQGAGGGDRNPAPGRDDRDTSAQDEQDGRGEQGRPGRWPTSGPGRFTAAAGESPIQGAGGPVRRYRVLVERDSGQDADAVAAVVDEALGDPRSWIASGELRVQRVASAADADFTVYLATPVTSERMCALGGLSTERYTSCRLPGQVIINLARWMEAVPDYGASLAVYRAYVVNHEVGHEFGELHESCPGPGEPAPVMQQQTYGLDGCVANPWPYLDGARYAGEPTAGT
ncbi:DUF3152 domain-containing protein [Micromonospora sp. KC207]|nr:DUF3152 domain-containing protein [Micromonospora sp. KC207]